MRTTSRFILSLVAIVLIVASTGAALYFYNKYQETKLKVPQSQQEQEAELAAVLPKVKKVVDLPDETPSIATVVDKAKLGDQPFFKDAANGDKVLIFSKAQKVLIFRPSTNRIVNFGAVILNNTQVPPAQTGSGTTATPLNVAIYYQGKDTAKAEDIAKKIKDNAAIPINFTAAPAKKAVTKTIIVDVNNKFQNAAAELAKLVDGEVAALPAGEDKPNADLLVIAAK